MATVALADGSIHTVVNIILPAAVAVAATVVDLGVIMILSIDTLPIKEDPIMFPVEVVVAVILIQTM
jgi:uncharacterized RDD family membrane protein YckC